jgi:hypothetical protein
MSNNPGAYRNSLAKINQLEVDYIYKGIWNAATNAFINEDASAGALVSSTGTQGDYYVITVAGATNLNGETDWLKGDWVWFNAGAWERIRTTEFTSGDITEGGGGSGSYFTEQKVRDTVLTGFSAVNSAIIASDSVIAAFGKAQGQIDNKQNTLGFTPENSANKNQISGYAGLDGSGKIFSSQLPAIALVDTFVVNSEAAMLALTAETGDVAVRTDLNKSFILKGTDPTVLADWQELLTPTDAVLSVQGKTGAITDLRLNDLANATADYDLNNFSLENLAGVISSHTTDEKIINFTHTQGGNDYTLDIKLGSSILSGTDGVFLGYGLSAYNFYFGSNGAWGVDSGDGTLFPRAAGNDFCSNANKPTFAWLNNLNLSGTLTLPSLTASTVPVLNGSKELISSAVTVTELNNVIGGTSSFQTQIDSKGAITGQAWTGSHSFAGLTTFTGNIQQNGANRTFGSSQRYEEHGFASENVSGGFGDRYYKIATINLTAQFAFCDLEGSFSTATGNSEFLYVEDFYIRIKQNLSMANPPTYHFEAINKSAYTTRRLLKLVKTVDNGTTKTFELYGNGYTATSPWRYFFKSSRSGNITITDTKAPGTAYDAAGLAALGTVYDSNRASFAYDYGTAAWVIA